MVGTAHALSSASRADKAKLWNERFLLPSFVQTGADHACNDVVKADIVFVSELVDSIHEAFR